MFWAGERIFKVIIYKGDHELARADTVSIARIAMSDDSFQRNNDYNLIDNNCEHFSTFCRTGKKHTWRVSRYGTVHGGRRVCFVLPTNIANTSHASHLANGRRVYGVLSTCNSL